MKVHLIKRQTIEDFVQQYAQSRAGFGIWLGLIRWADWEKPSDIVATFRSADILGKGTDRVVFNIGGNHFRLICQYHFGRKKVHLFVCWIGTHKAYDQLCHQGRQYEVKDY